MNIYTSLNEIKNHAPCPDGWEKLLRGLNKTKPDDEPLSFKYILKNNGIKDAVWALRVLPFKEQSLFRADVAESVLHIFEEEYPDERRPRLAINVLRGYANGGVTEDDLREARSATRDVSYAVANSASIAAAVVVITSPVAPSIDAAAYAVSAVANAVAPIAASATASAAAYIHEQKWQVIEKLFVKHFCGE